MTCINIMMADGALYCQKFKIYGKVLYHIKKNDSDWIVPAQSCAMANDAPQGEHVTQV
jgi:hypothetical protein